MRKTPLAIFCSAALLLGAAVGCTADRADPSIAAQDPAVAEPATPTMDTADPMITGSAPMTHQASSLGVAIGAHGQYLVDSRGHALYLLENDTDGSACTDACLEVWPLLRADQAASGGGAADAGAEMPSAGQTATSTAATTTAAAGATSTTGATGLSAELIGAVQRPDGIVQLTYDGHPLYHHLRDQGREQTTGHEVTDQWGEWYLLGSDGEPLGHEG